MIDANYSMVGMAGRGVTNENANITKRYIDAPNASYVRVGTITPTTAGADDFVYCFIAIFR
jgi:hypothetical protein